MKPIHANGHPETEIYTYLSRRSLIKMVGLSTISMGLWVSACDQSNADSAPAVENKKENKMESTTSIPNSKTRIPPIDAALPTKTSTATFALG